MKIVYCPECGEKMRDESIGWRCPKCKGFVSFVDGKFYPHIERPFVPPMTERLGLSDRTIQMWRVRMGYKANAPAHRAKKEGNSNG